MTRKPQLINIHSGLTESPIVSLFHDDNKISYYHLIRFFLLLNFSHLRRFFQPCGDHSATRRCFLMERWGSRWENVVVVFNGGWGGLGWVGVGWDGLGWVGMGWDGGVGSPSQMK